MVTRSAAGLNSEIPYRKQGPQFKSGISERFATAFESIDDGENTRDFKPEITGVLDRS